MHVRKELACVLGLIMVFVMWPSMASAQGQLLEEVVVTAQRRESNLQQTPLSVTAFTSRDLEMRGIETGRDLTIQVPNLFVAGEIAVERDARLFLRGIPGIGIYMDGVWQGNTGALFTNLVEMERVEVLRGPQGTLFGRNTNGGAIQYITQLPSDEFGVRGHVELGDFDREQVSVTVDAPITANLRTKWFAASLKRDGFIDSASVGKSYGGQDDVLFRGDVLWTPTNRFELRFTINDVDQESSSARVTRIGTPDHRWILPFNVAVMNPAFLQENGGTLPNSTFTREDQQAGFPGGALNEWQNTLDAPTDGITFDSRDYTLTLEWDIAENISLRSITGVLEDDSRAVTDFDSTQFNHFTSDSRRFDEERSQELHLTGSNFDGRVQWLAGLYYLETESRNGESNQRLSVDAPRVLGSYRCSG